jgi:hypothetical protein
MQYEFARHVVVVDPAQRYVETRFPDGTTVGATPNRDDHSLRIARDLGYGDDTWAMSLDHELCHSWLAQVADQPWSPTLWRLAHPDDLDVANDVEVAEEEARVLEFQRRLDKDAPRPWDTAPVPRRAPGLPW